MSEINGWTIKKLLDEFEEMKELCKKMDWNGKIDSTGALRALENIGRLCGFYEEKVRHSGNVNVNNPFEDLTTEELKKLIDK